jgi:hypothetical protein
MATKTPNANQIAVTLHLSEDAYRYLRALGKSCAVGGKGTVEDVLLHLAHSAADGVRRPGAWERGWLTQAFSDDWTESMRAHPSVFYCQVPADFDDPLPTASAREGAAAKEVLACALYEARERYLQGVGARPGPEWSKLSNAERASWFAVADAIDLETGTPAPESGGGSQ